MISSFLNRHTVGDIIIWSPAKFAGLLTSKEIKSLILMNRHQHKKHIKCINWFAFIEWNPLCELLPYCDGEVCIYWGGCPWYGLPWSWVRDQTESNSKTHMSTVHLARDKAAKAPSLPSQSQVSKRFCPRSGTSIFLKWKSISGCCSRVRVEGSDRSPDGFALRLQWCGRCTGLSWWRKSWA